MDIPLPGEEGLLFPSPPVPEDIPLPPVVDLDIVDLDTLDNEDVEVLFVRGPEGRLAGVPVPTAKPPAAPGAALVPSPPSPPSPPGPPAPPGPVPVPPGPCKVQGPSPRPRDVYSPSKPSGDQDHLPPPQSTARLPSPTPGEGVETLAAWRKRQERKLIKGGLGLPPPLPPPPLEPPPAEVRPAPPNVIDNFPKKLAVKMPGPILPPPPDYFIKDADIAEEREKERKRFLTNSALGQDEAKMRLKAYAAMKEGNFGLMYPSAEKKKNKELKKFFEEENKSDIKPKAKAGRVSDNLMDKMAEITREIELEKAEHDKAVEQHIKKLKERNYEKASRSRSRSPRGKKKRSTRSRSTSKLKSSRKSESRKKSRSTSKSHKRSRSTSKPRKKLRSTSRSRKKSRSTSKPRKKSRSTSRPRKKSRSTSRHKKSTSRPRKKSRSTS